MTTRDEAAPSARRAAALAMLKTPAADAYDYLAKVEAGLDALTCAAAQCSDGGTDSPLAWVRALAADLPAARRDVLRLNGLAIHALAAMGRADRRQKAARKAMRRAA